MIKREIGQDFLDDNTYTTNAIIAITIIVKSSINVTFESGTLMNVPKQAH